MVNSNGRSPHPTPAAGAGGPGTPPGRLYRRLRGLAPDARLVGIVSCRHGEGASTVARHLAGQAARAGEPTLLVTEDCPPRDDLGVAGDKNAAPAAGKANPGPCLETSSWEKLGLGASSSVPAEAGVLLAELRQRFGLTLLDMPPLETVQPWRLAERLDGLLVVIEAGRSPAREVRATLARLQRRATVLGLVLNRCEPAEDD